MHRFPHRTFMLLACFAVAACDGSTQEEAPAADMTADTAPAGADATANAPASDALLNPDSATAEQLAAIPGLDADLAARIVAAAPFENMLEVDSLLAGSLSEVQREEVYGRLFKPLDLNSATGEEIQLIPGVGDRMQHEFEEYRPYTAIEQFRREIGKYVDDEEVARLERYVTIR